MSAQAAAAPEPWESMRKVNIPYPGGSGLRVIGFVVPDDGEPLALITEKLRKIIGHAPPTPVATQEPVARIKAFAGTNNWTVEFLGKVSPGDLLYAAPPAERVAQLESLLQEALVSMDGANSPLEERIRAALEG